MTDNKTTLQYTIGNFNEPGIRIQLTGFDFDLSNERNKKAAEIITKMIGLELYAFSTGSKVDKKTMCALVEHINNL